MTKICDFLTYYRRSEGLSGWKCLLLDYFILKCDSQTEQNRFFLHGCVQCFVLFGFIHVRVERLQCHLLTFRMYYSITGANGQSYL